MRRLYMHTFNVDDKVPKQQIWYIYIIGLKFAILLAGLVVYNYLLL